MGRFTLLRRVSDCIYTLLWQSKSSPKRCTATANTLNMNGRVPNCWKLAGSWTGVRRGVRK